MFVFEIVCGLPRSPVKFQVVKLTTGVAQELSPLKKVVALGVPVADRSIIPVLTAPVAATFAVAAATTLTGRGEASIPF